MGRISIWGGPRPLARPSMGNVIGGAVPPPRHVLGGLLICHPWKVGGVVWVEGLVLRLQILLLAEALPHEIQNFVALNKILGHVNFDAVAIKLRTILRKELV